MHRLHSSTSLFEWDAQPARSRQTKPPDAKPATKNAKDIDSVPAGTRQARVSLTGIDGPLRLSDFRRVINKAPPFRLLNKYVTLLRWLESCLHC